MDGAVECLRGSHGSARSIPAGFCRGNGLYVRVAGIGFFERTKIHNPVLFV